MNIIYKNILVAVDGSEASENAFDKAVAIAKSNKSQLVIVHAIDSRSFSMLGGHIKRFLLKIQRVSQTNY
jgi:nucleotide-binding universal stress UspA family protein